MGVWRRNSCLIGLTLMISWCITGKCSRTIQLSGEPKSGTSFLWSIMITSVKTLCSRSYKCGGIKQTRMSRRPTKIAYISYKLEGSGEMLLNGEGKHHFFFSSHPNNFAFEPPCNISFSYPNTPLTADIEVCTTELFGQYLEKVGESPPKKRKDKVYVNILRDPRDVVISGCFHLSKAVDTKALEDCILNMYPITSLWVKARELISSIQNKHNQNLNSSISYVDVVYRKLVEGSESEVAKIVNAMGFGSNGGINNNQPLPVKTEDVKKILYLTSAQSMRDKSNKEVLVRADTLREGGRKNFNDYNISSDVVHWMTAVFEKLSFHKI